MLRWLKLFRRGPERWRFRHDTDRISGIFISREEAERCAKNLFGPNYKKLCSFEKVGR